MNEEKLREHRYPVHTANAIIERCSKILFLKRRNESYKGNLVIPGGTLNKGERVEAAAIREVKEETSLDLELDSILGVYSNPVRDPREHKISTVLSEKSRIITTK
jgi:8-oxo-dGTP diphosphatase